MREFALLNGGMPDDLKWIIRGCQECNPRAEAWPGPDLWLLCERHTAVVFWRPHLIVVPWEPAPQKTRGA